MHVSSAIVKALGPHVPQSFWSMVNRLVLYIAGMAAKMRAETIRAFAIIMF